MLTYFRALARPEQLSIERWLPVVGWEGIYEVSDHGRIRSLTRKDSTGRTRRGRVLRPDTYRGGYLRVSLALGGGVTRRSVHHLVLEAFFGPCPDGMEGCHNNGVPNENRLSNLRWDTHPANVADSIRQGTNRNTRKTHCPRGHALVEPNLTAYSLRVGRRSCLACARAHGFAQGRGISLTQEIADDYYQRIGVAA